MKTLFHCVLLMMPPLANAQEAAEKSGSSNMYFMGAGLVVFLALIGVISIYEKFRDYVDAKNELAEEEARKLRIENAEREAKLKADSKL